MALNRKNRIIGIDPGLRHTGWAIVDSIDRSFSYVASGVINTDASDEMPVRLNKIHTHLKDILMQYDPNHASIEETYVNKNYASSLKLAHARGAAIVTIGAHNIPLAEYAAKSVKKTIVGVGNAEKGQIMRMLQILVPGTNISSEDESDALSIAVCHALHF